MLFLTRNSLLGLSNEGNAPVLLVWSLHIRSRARFVALSSLRDFSVLMLPDHNEQRDIAADTMIAYSSRVLSPTTSPSLRRTNTAKD